MDSSPGFASTRRNLCSPCSDSLSLRLAYSLTSLRTVTRWLILQKARRHPAIAGFRAPTACRHTVSGTISLPSRGAFHLSLTVLVHYRSQESIQPWRVVPPDSYRISRVRHYSGTALAGAAVSRTGLLTRYGRPFQASSATTTLCNCARGLTPPRCTALQHHMQQRRQACTCMGLGWFPFRSPLLRESRLISFPPGT